MTTEWWETFFEGAPNEFWRRVAGAAMTEPEVEAIVRWLEPAPGAALLDVPCGQGRHALALAERGFAVAGLDFAEENVEWAARAARERGLAAEFRRGDMRALPWRGAFAGAYCLGNSFGYFEDDASHARFLRAVAAALVPGGRFVLEAICLETLIPQFQAERTFSLGDVAMSSRARYDARRGRLVTEYTFSGDGRSETRPAAYRLYAVNEIVALLRAAGFAEPELFGAPDGSAFALGSPRLYAVAALE